MTSPDSSSESGLANSLTETTRLDRVPRDKVPSVGESAVVNGGGSTGAGRCPVTGQVQRLPGREPLFGSELTQNVAETVRRWRRDYGPIVPIELEGGFPAWLVIGYRELRYVTNNSELFTRDFPCWNKWSQLPDDWRLLNFVRPDGSLFFLEGEEHTRRSLAMSRALGNINQVDLRLLCEEIADQAVDVFAGRGTAELMQDYVNLVPMLICGHLVGLSQEQSRSVMRMMMGAIDSHEGMRDDGRRFEQTMLEIMRNRSTRSGNDLASKLRDEDLTEEEMLLDLRSTLLVSQQMVASWVGNTLRLMLTDERFALSLLGGRNDATQALNEVLWEDNPNLHVIGRIAKRACDLGGRRIAEGDMVVLGLLAANHDPMVKPSPEAMSRNNAQVSFGGGDHGCPYPAPALSHTIAKACVEVLLDRLPDLHLTTEPHELRWRDTVFVRCLEALPVEFTPVALRG